MLWFANAHGCCNHWGSMDATIALGYMEGKLVEYVPSSLLTPPSSLPPIDFLVHLNVKFWGDISLQSCKAVLQGRCSSGSRTTHDLLVSVPVDGFFKAIFYTDDVVAERVFIRRGGALVCVDAGDSKGDFYYGMSPSKTSISIAEWARVNSVFPEIGKRWKREMTTF